MGFGWVASTSCAHPFSIICAPTRSSAALISMYYGDWFAHCMFLFVPAQAAVAHELETFKEFPPRAKAASFTVSDAMDNIIVCKQGRRQLTNTTGLNCRSVVRGQAGFSMKDD